MTEHITVRALSNHTGAEIAGLDLSRSLNAQSLATITDALHEWGVVLFRNQVLTEA